MPSPAAAVTDTHPLLFHAAGGRRLGRRAARLFQRAEEQAAILYVPVVSLWECSLLARAGRIDFGRSVESFCGDLFSNPAFQPVDITAEHIYIADRSRPNDDPFDALICAVATDLNLPLVTRDSEIEAAGIVPTLWA